MKDILIDLRNDFTQAANHDRMEKMAAYMKNKFSFFGIDTTTRREITKPYLTAIKSAPISEIIDIVDQLWVEDEREFQMFGLDILSKTHKKLKPENISNIQYWVTHKSWWDTVDFLAAHVIGHQFKNKDTKSQHIPLWMASDNIWLNRCCLIHQLFYKEGTDFEQLKTNIQKLKHKKEFFIQKAIGWSLRQHSKYDPEVVEEFIIAEELKGLAAREGMKHIQRGR